jgi:hypothetical protein
VREVIFVSAKAGSTTTIFSIVKRAAQIVVRQKANYRVRKCPWRCMGFKRDATAQSFAQVFSDANHSNVGDWAASAWFSGLMSWF